jgi:hypothetical protein
LLKNIVEYGRLPIIRGGGVNPGPIWIKKELKISSEKSVVEVTFKKKAVRRTVELTCYQLQQ